ncbi:MAG: hypothetical protein NTZ43_15045 [Gemmatimonadetes bacterium]|nr:hypothetical protein [Gemmatimonadota bacterium]
MKAVGNGDIFRQALPDPTRPTEAFVTQYDDKKIQALVKKLSKTAKPKTDGLKTYDKTAPQRTADDTAIERDRFFKEMKRREF